MTISYLYTDIAKIQEISYMEKFIKNIIYTLAFSRIRYTDSVYARNNRHREVAQSVYDESLKRDPMTYKKSANILLNNTKTNISPMEMLDFGYTICNTKDSKIEQMEFPLEGHRNGHIISK